MKEILKYGLLMVGLALVAFYVYYLVTFLSPGSSLFAPR